MRRSEIIEGQEPAGSQIQQQNVGLSEMLAEFPSINRVSGHGVSVHAAMGTSKSRWL